MIHIPSINDCLITSLQFIVAILVIIVCLFIVLPISLLFGSIKWCLDRLLDLILNTTNECDG